MDSNVDDTTTSNVSSTTVQEEDDNNDSSSIVSNSIIYPTLDTILHQQEWDFTTHKIHDNFLSIPLS
jgi:hypothetical protein